MSQRHWRPRPRGAPATEAAGTGSMPLPGSPPRRAPMPRYVTPAGASARRDAGVWWRDLSRAVQLNEPGVSRFGPNNSRVQNSLWCVMFRSLSLSLSLYTPSFRILAPSAPAIYLPTYLRRQRVAAAGLKISTSSTCWEGKKVNLSFFPETTVLKRVLVFPEIHSTRRDNFPKPNTACWMGSLVRDVLRFLGTSGQLRIKASHPKKRAGPR